MRRYPLSTGFDGNAVRLYEKIALLRQQLRELEQIKELLKKEPERQLSLTDPRAGSVTSGGKRTGTVGYYVHTAGDTKHHLFVEPAQGRPHCHLKERCSPSDL